MAAKVPTSLKPIAHYIKIANENSNRDPVVYYWCLFYAAQNAMQLDKSSPEALHFLTGLLGTLESIKKQLTGTEAITNEVIAQAHLENYALKLFNFADAKEKSGQVDKSVVHAFYTAGHVMDVLSLFGETSVLEVAHLAKINKNRRVLVGIHHVLYDHVGVQETETLYDASSIPSNKDATLPYDDRSQSLPPNAGHPQPPTSNYGFAGLPNVPGASSTYPSSALRPQSQPCSSNVAPTNEMNGLNIDSSKIEERKPSVEDFNEARKFTKYALSAIDYEDTRAVVDNLRKALALMERV